MGNKIKTGQQGEAAAAQLLQTKGYEVVTRNYRHKKSEIDLIVRKDNWLVFVEVKTRRSQAFGYPEEFLGAQQVEKILEGAAAYLEQTNWQGNVRYDIVAVSICGGELLAEHIEDAFY